MCVWGGDAWYPEAQVHVYEFTPCEHVPPCKHGRETHSSTSVSQIIPMYPATHVHAYASGSILDVLESEHVEPFKHGEEAHSSLSTSQLKPV